MPLTFQHRISPEQVEARLQSHRTVSLPGHSVVYSQGGEEGRVYFLASGVVKLAFFSRAGHEKLVCVLKPGQFFGEVGAFRFYGITAITMAPSRICVIPLNETERWLRSDPELTRLLLDSMAHKLWLMGRQLCNMSFHDAYGVVACTLLDLHHEDTIGESGASGIRLTQEQLGQLTGLSRVTISKALHSMVQRGLVQLRRGELTVLNPAGLRSLTRI